MSEKTTPEDLEQMVKELETERACRKEAEHKLEGIFHKSLDALIIIDTKSGLILNVNETTRQILGYEEGELKGKHFSTLFPLADESSKKDLADEFNVFGTVFTQDFVRSDGSVCLLDLTATMVRWGKGEAILAAFRDSSERRQMEEEREKLIRELKDALANVKTLSGLLPICSSCKKIRDDKGYWNQIESYIRDRSEAEFTHGICPKCAKKLYPDFFQGD